MILLIASLLAIGSQAYAPIQIVPSQGKGLIVLPKGFPGNIRGTLTQQQLSVRNPTANDSPSSIPYFTAKIDQTITWDDMDWCLEATGNKRGDTIRVNSCSGSQTQKWNWIPDGRGHNLIQLKDTELCLDTINKEVGTNGAPIKLRVCGSEVTQWQFEESLPLLGISQADDFTQKARHVMITLFTLAGVGAVSLGAWIWHWFAKGSQDQETVPTIMAVNDLQMHRSHAAQPSASRTSDIAMAEYKAFMDKQLDDSLERELETSSFNHADVDHKTNGRHAHATFPIARQTPFRLQMQLPPPARQASHSNVLARRTRMRMMAGPPQYDKIDGLLREAEVVGEGSVMLHVDVTGNTPIDYKPGHVLALEMEDKDGVAGTNSAENGGWMRGPYTVSRSTEDTLDVLIKVVGGKSRAFAAAKPNTPVKFGGKFHVPILDGIAKSEIKRVVLISTGVGVGPCVGAIELALEDKAFPPIELFASYRSRGEVVYSDLLNSLSETNPHRFKWNAVITSESGRISGGDNIDAVCVKGFGLSDTHFHVIGNAQMVNEWKLGLKKAGVPDDNVTNEMYFNHKAEVSATAVDGIAAAISAGCAADE